MPPELDICGITGGGCERGVLVWHQRIGMVRMVLQVVPSQVGGLLEVTVMQLTLSKMWMWPFIRKLFNECSFKMYPM